MLDISHQPEQEARNASNISVQLSASIILGLAAGRALAIILAACGIVTGALFYQLLVLSFVSGTVGIGLECH